MRTVVGILGVTHEEEHRRQYGLPLELIEELILSFNPDVICGEVLPASWEHYKRNPALKGYWGEPPSEYWDLIFPLCERQGITFIPIDWVELDVWEAFDPFHGLPVDLQARYQEELQVWQEKQLSTTRDALLPYNSLEFDRNTKEMYAWLRGINEESHLLRWECRHLIMIQRIKQAINRYPGQRVLCIAGADHNHRLHEGLSQVSDIDLVYPLQRGELRI